MRVGRVARFADAAGRVGAPVHVLLFARLRMRFERFFARGVQVLRVRLLLFLHVFKRRRLVLGVVRGADVVRVVLRLVLRLFERCFVVHAWSMGKKGAAGHELRGFAS